MEPANQQPATSNQQPAFADAWARFHALDSLRVDGDTLDYEFTRGRAQFLAFLVRIEDRAAVDYLSRVAERLDGITGVETYPDWYWHMTVKGAGFQVIKRAHEDDVLREDVPRIAGKARALLTNEPAFEVQIGLASGFPEVAFAEVYDGGRIRELNTRLLESIPELARYPFDGELFLPHVSVARFHSNEGLAELISALAELREQGPGPAFTVARIEFVKAWLSEEVPEFDTLATYPLKAPR